MGSSREVVRTTVDPVKVQRSFRRIKSEPRMPPARSPLLCPGCGHDVAATDPACPACGLRWIDPAVRQGLHDRLEELMAHLARGPYFRSAATTAYTLGSRQRGFVEDPRHPFSRRVLAHLHQRACALEAEAPPEWTLAALREDLRAGDPRVAAIVAAIAERYAKALDRARTVPDFETWYAQVVAEWG